jgi:hypothetical protein
MRLLHRPEIKRGADCRPGQPCSIFAKHIYRQYHPGYEYLASPVAGRAQEHRQQEAHYAAKLGGVRKDRRGSSDLRAPGALDPATDNPPALKRR